MTVVAAGTCAHCSCAAAGTWVGIEYDFVLGEDGEMPGLPDENVRCMDGT